MIGWSVRMQMAADEPTPLRHLRRFPGNWRPDAPADSLELETLETEPPVDHRFAYSRDPCRSERSVKPSADDPRSSGGFARGLRRFGGRTVALIRWHSQDFRQNTPTAIDGYPVRWNSLLNKRIHQNRRRHLPFSGRHLCPFPVNLRPISSSDQFELKRRSIDHSKSYRTVSLNIKFVQN